MTEKQKRRPVFVGVGVSIGISVQFETDSAKSEISSSTFEKEQIQDEAGSRSNTLDTLPEMIGSTASEREIPDFDDYVADDDNPLTGFFTQTTTNSKNADFETTANPEFEQMNEIHPVGESSSIIEADGSSPTIDNYAPLRNSQTDRSSTSTLADRSCSPYNRTFPKLSADNDPTLPGSISSGSCSDSNKIDTDPTFKIKIVSTPITSFTSFTPFNANAEFGKEEGKSSAAARVEGQPSSTPTSDSTQLNKRD